MTGAHMPRETTAIALEYLPEWNATDALRPQFEVLQDFIPKVLATGFSPGSDTTRGEILIAEFLASVDAQSSAAYVTAITEWVLHYNRLSDQQKESDRESKRSKTLWYTRQVLAYTLRGLLRRKVAIDLRAMAALSKWLAVSNYMCETNYPVKSIIRAMTAYAAATPLTPELCAEMTRASATLRKTLETRVMSKLADEIDRLVKIAQQTEPDPANAAHMVTQVSSIKSPSPSADPAYLSSLVDQLLRVDPSEASDFDDISQRPEVKTILALPLTDQLTIVRDCIDRIGATRERLGDPNQNLHKYMNLHHSSHFPSPALYLASRLLKRKLPVTAADITFMVDRVAHLKMVSVWSIPFLPAIVSLAESHAKLGPLPLDLKNALGRLNKALSFFSNSAETRLRQRIQGILGASSAVSPVKPGEAWSDAAIADTAASSSWGRLLDHCRTATTAQPSPKWLQTAKEHLSAVTPPAFIKGILDWLPLLSKPRTRPLADHNWRVSMPEWSLEETNTDILRGLCWTTTLVSHPEIPGALADFVTISLKKLPGIGPRYPKLANAGIYALGAIEDSNALGQLARLKVRVHFGTAQKAIEKALNASAARRGMSREDLEELGVPTYGFSPDGLRTETLGDCRVELRITGTDVSTTWFNAKNKQVKAVPAEIKRDHAETLKEIKGAALDAAAMLTAQRSRLDNLMSSTKAWSITDFRTRYLDHPISGAIARKLVWLVDGIPVLFQNGQALDVDGKPITHGQTADITIWHPALRPTAEILAWRNRLETLQITQPFKQAHREIYLLTDAERNTRTYSNRFAAHIIKQHQFNALVAARGWKSKLRLMVDDTYTAPCKILPQFNLRAEFWVEGSGDQYGLDTNDTGVYLRLATDQVRFYSIDSAQPSAHASGGGYGGGYRQPLAAEPLPLDQVPALAFSEIMRDVDLFVGVCSIANDPNWTDGAHTAAQNNYWQSQSFGALSVTGQTRKSVLESLLPRLAIAPQCALSDKFLLVKGTKRTYKIHLGSGNILMEPNDQYLCIVPDSSARSAASAQDIYLPFEGDNVLSIILSKALLLANDHKITDPSILSQIARN
jgi:hypothetical protein